MVKCKNPKCGNKFEGRSNKLFCSTKCETRFNAEKRYNRLKDNPKFKADAIKRFKEWREKHPNYHKEYYQRRKNENTKRQST